MATILDSSKFEQIQELRELLKETLPISLSKEIVSFNLKGELLTLKVKHQIYKQQIEGFFTQNPFEYKVRCEVVFKKPERAKVKPKQSYDERARGEFDTSHIKDGNIKKILEEIKGIIKR